MKLPILNRSNAIPADGWYQIEVTGEHPASGNKVQVIDDVALTAIVNRLHFIATGRMFTSDLDRESLS